MKIKDVIKKINKTKEFEDKVYIGDIAKEFDLEHIQNYDDQTRLTCYYLGNWYCTDIYVGYRVYFFDDEPVAISVQHGRKYDEDFEWISKECYKKVKEYIKSFEEEFESRIDIIDLEQEIGETYKISYYEQMFEHHKNNAFYKNEKVKVIDFKDHIMDNTRNKYEPETVLIKYESNEKEEWVQPKDLDFPFNLVKL